MIDLREAARRLDWHQARTDAVAIANKQVSLSQLPEARQGNLQRAREILTKLALDENYYRAQSLNRLGTYEKLKDEYVKYIRIRDEAAYQGAVGSIGLALAYSVDAVGHGLAAAGIPLAKFYTVVRGVGDKSVAAYDTLRAYRQSPGAGSDVATSTDRSTAVSPAQTRPGAAAEQGGQIPDMGFRIAHGLPASRDARSQAGTGVASSAHSPAPGHTADENIRAVTAPAGAVREIHKAAEETTKLHESLPGKDRREEWISPQPNADKAQPEQFGTSKGLGDIADSTLKTLDSIAELDAARRSRDGDRIYKAETEAMRSALKSGSTMLETLQKQREVAGEQTPGGKLPGTEAFKMGDKIVGATQTAVSGVEAYLEIRDGRYDKAWEHARDGATNAAKTFSKYGEQYEAGGKAIDALVKYGQATDTRQKVTSLLEYAGQGVKAGGVIPGASDAGESILRGRAVVEQGFNLKDAYDLGKRDDFKPNLDRLADQIRGDYDLYNRLKEFRDVLNLPARRQPVDLPSTPP